MRIRDFCVLAAWVLLGAAAAQAGAAAAGGYVFTTLDVPGGAITQTTGVPDSLNARDQVAGSTMDAAHVYRGFVWTAGQFGLYPACDILAVINDAGVAAGYPASGGGYCLVATASGRTQRFSVGGGSGLRLEAIDRRGRVLAQITNRQDVTQGLLLEGGVAQTVMVPGSGQRYGGTFATGLNDGGTIAGYYADAAGRVHGFTALGGVYEAFDVPGGSGTYPYVIDAAGDVGGGYLTSGSGGATTGFVRIGGRFETIAPPGAQGSEVQGFGPDGEIVGSYVDGGGVEHGFATRAGRYARIDVPGASRTQVSGVNARGSLVGNWYDAQGVAHAFVAEVGGGGPAYQG